MDMRVVESDAALEYGCDSGFLKALPFPLCICDSSGVILQSNIEFNTLFAYQEESLLGFPLSSLIADESGCHNELEQFFLNSVKQQARMEKDTVGQRANDSSFSMRLSVSPVEVVQGKQFVVSVTDISTRQLVENNFEQIFETAPIGILVTTADGVIRHGNQQITSIFGYSIDDLRNKSLEVLLPERHRDKHVEHRQNYSANPVRRAMGTERDLTGLHKNGKEFPVEIGLNPIVSNSGTYIVATVTDITQRKKSELKLKQLNADLDEFTYVASHDLKSPLRGIASLIEWIEEDIGDNMTDDLRNNIERVNLRIDRMEKLVEDLLSYARSGQQQTDPEAIVLGDMIEDTFQFISPPESFKISVHGYLGEIQSYATPLETVLRNIIGNAVKHHDKEQGCITVNIETSGSFCVFEIKDDGPGIPAAAQERVFKLFQTLSNDDGARSGVGLAVSKRMIESQGGRIEVHSDDGSRGTCFKFWWPRFLRRDINEQ